MNNNSNRFWLIGGLLMMGFIVLNTVIAYRSVRVLELNQNGVTHSLRVLTIIKDLHTQIVSAESGQRGYLITDDEPYLQPYNRALAVLDELLVELSQETTEIPLQKQNFEELYQMSIAKVQELQEGITLKQQNKHKAALYTFHDDEGLTLTEKIVAKVNEMEDLENSMLAKRAKESRSNRKSAMRTLLLSNSLGAILIVVIYFTMNRHLRQKLMYTDLLHQANEDLENKVKERTESLEHYSEELARSNRELQNFAFVASHDLQEPLRKIRAFGARLQQTCSDELGEKGVDYINRMFSASERMSVLIDDLLAFSRVFTQQKPYEEIDLALLVDEVVDDLEIAINETEAQIDIDSLPSISGDAGQMRRLFQNLISNALKFRHPDRNPHIQILCATTTPEDDDAYHTIRIKDNGIGFEQKFSEKIFTLFQRLHGRDEYGGTGLGLAICRRIVERHGGSIRAESSLDHGAEFIIELPVEHTLNELVFKNEEAVGND
ncbi:Phytochrome-like protein cph1 [Thalassocella blandensis]|nr:Phytochrome-like protein cph1 [Thalassocella blandensis]